MMSKQSGGGAEHSKGTKRFRDKRRGYFNLIWSKKMFHLRTSLCIIILEEQREWQRNQIISARASTQVLK
jgi:hypothetical protein